MPAAVLFLGHLSRQLRVERLLVDVRTGFVSVVGELETEFDTVADELGSPISALELQAQGSGFLVQADEAALRKVAERFDAVIVVQRRPGDFLVEGIPFTRAWKVDWTLEGYWSAEETQELQQAVNDAVTVGFERNSVQAVRAISPSVNDPTTCVHALGHLAARLSTLASKDQRHRMVSDREGPVRVFLQRRTFPMLLELVVSQMCTYGMDDSRVARRLVQLLAEVDSNNASGRHGEAIYQQRQRVARALSKSQLDPVDRQNLLTEYEATA